MKKDDISTLYTPDFIQEIKQIVTNARQKAYVAINSAMVEAYWLMGKRIVEQEQEGKGRWLRFAAIEIALERTYRRIWQRFLCWVVILLSPILSDFSWNIRYTVANFDMVTLQACNAGF